CSGRRYRRPAARLVTSLSIASDAGLHITCPHVTRRVPAWLATPAVAGLALLLVYPTICLVALAVTKSSLAKPLNRFTGLANFTGAFASPAFTPSLWKSTIFAVLVA